MFKETIPQMRVLLQRVKNAHVEIAEQIAGTIGNGYLLFVGFAKEDKYELLEPMLEKIVGLKLFSDKNKRLSFSLNEVKGEVLIISQFTLCAGLKKGRKPNFSAACEHKQAEMLYEKWVELWKSKTDKVQTGIFGADMQVHLTNDGPVTILLDSKELFPLLHQS